MDANPSDQPHNPYAHPGNPTTSTSIGATTTTGRYCIRCAYALAGLPVDGKCPECGTFIELSLREPTLTNADPEYLDTLRTGLSFVLTGLILTIIVTVGGTILAAISGLANSRSFEIVLRGGLVVVSGLILFGYWKYTTPDPSQVALESTNSARSTIRTVVLAQAVLSIVSFLVSALEPVLPPAPAPAPVPGQSSGMFGVVPMATTAQIIAIILATVSLVLWIVQFVSVMRYTRWLATRVPDSFIVRRTKTYPWLLPLIYVLGMACIGLGPLIAFVLYWTLLNRLRRHVSSIIMHGGPAKLENMAQTVA